MIFIVIPVFNRLDYTIDCLKSIQGQEFKEYKVIVCDDGSTDGTAEKVLRDFPGVTLLRGDGNLWWSGTMNLGVQHVLQIANQDDYILSLNNDLTLPIDYLGNLYACALQNKRAIIGSISVDKESNRVIDGGVRTNWVTAKYERLNIGLLYDKTTASLMQAAIKVDLLSGRGSLIPIGVFQEIGLYDARHLPHYFGDYEFSHRAMRAGYPLFCSYRAVVLSHPSSSGADVAKAVNFITYVSSRKSSANIVARTRYAWLIRRNVIQFLSFLLFDYARTFIHYFRKPNPSVH